MTSIKKENNTGSRSESSERKNEQQMQDEAEEKSRMREFLGIKSYTNSNLTQQSQDFDKVGEGNVEIKDERVDEVKSLRGPVLR